MIFIDALKIANKYLKVLHPHCERIEIAGSLRRMKSEVHDIEFVCIPKKYPHKNGLFDIEMVPVTGFQNEINKLERIKGDPTGKYCARKLPEGINLDIFIADENNFGLIMLIRTGSADFNKRILNHGKYKCGIASVDGQLIKNNKIIPVKEETEIFALFGVEYIEPQFRMN